MSALTVNELKDRFAAGDRPSAKDFSDFIDSVQAWIADTLNPVSPGIALLYSPAALTTATYAAVYSPPVAGYLDGTVLAFKADLVNPSGGTNFDAGLGPHPILRERGVALKAGDIQPNQIVEVRYSLSATAWVMMSPTSHPGLRSGDIVKSAFALEEDGTRFLCNGQSVDTNVYPSLTPLSTTFGVPSPNDGHHVKLPDLRAHFPVGVGTLPSTAVINRGDVGGAEDVTLTAAQSGSPAHTHDMVPNWVDYSGGAQGLLGSGAQGDGGNVTGGVTGGAQPASASHTNLPPYLGLFFYILT